MEPVDKLFSSAVEIYKKNFKVLSILGVLYSLFWLIFVMVNDASIRFGLSWMTFFTFLIVLLSYVYFEIVLIRLVDVSNFSIRKALEIDLGRFLKAVWTDFLKGFITYGAYFLILIPGLILGIWFKFAMWEVVLNNKKGLLALRASRNLVRGSFWQVFGRSLMLSILTWVLIAMNAYATIAFVELRPAMIFLQAVIYVFWVPFAFIVNNLMYKNLKQLQESGNKEKSGSGRKYLAIGVLGYLFSGVLLVFSVIFVVLFILGKRDGGIFERVRDEQIQKIQKQIKAYRNQNGRYPKDLRKFSRDEDFTYHVDRSGRVYMLCYLLADKMKCFGPDGKVIPDK